MNFKDLKKQQTLYEDSTKIMHRVYSEEHACNYIIKAYKKENSDPYQNFVLENEFKLCKKTNCSSLLIPRELILNQNKMIQIWENFPGCSLKEWIQNNNTVSYSTFFKLAIRLTEQLSVLHKSGYAHNSINSHNILINPKSLDIKFINLDTSFKISKYEHETQLRLANSSFLEYISPEQTGRMNKTLNYQTDFYSLGIVLFECLTGRLPYLATQKLDLLYAHLAEVPPAPDSLRNDVPEVVSDIISKCMAKNAKDRYFDAQGLKRDLELCHESFTELKEVPDFKIGQYDHKSRFSLSNNLYGRDEEVKTLLKLFRESLKTGSQMVLITGESGIGKSRLVDELYEPVMEKKGYFARGKFDQYERNIPYSGIIKAMQLLVNQILNEGPESIKLWRLKFSEILKDYAHIIVDVIPELEIILGAKVSKTNVPSSDSQLAFHLQFQRFIDVFTKNNRPLILFLDDLQWADSESLAMIEFLLHDKGHQNFMLIGAYRSDEAKRYPTFKNFLLSIKDNNISPLEICIKNLKKIDIQNLILDSFSGSPKISKDLANIVFKKTIGNPFFVRQFLNLLNSKDLCKFNFKRGIWEWDINKVKELGVTKNVVELVIDQIHKLPSDSQHVLKVAACIGHTFDMETLFEVYDGDKSQLGNALLEAIDSSYILAKIEDIRFLNSLPGLTKSIDWKSHGFNCKFLHDKVYESAYKILSKQDKEKYHSKIGRLWLDNHFNKSIIDVVSHLNRGNPGSKEKLAQLNLEAGNKSRENGAYNKAYDFYTYGLGLLENPWKNFYPLTFQLYLGIFECHYLMRNYEEADKIFELMIKSCSTNFDKAKVFNTKLILQLTLNKHLEAFDSGREALRLLGVTLNFRPGIGHVLVEYTKSKIKLPKGFKEEELNLFPETNDDKIKLIIELLMNLTAPAYFLNKNLFAYIILKTVNMSQDFGNASSSSYAYSTYGTLLGSVFKDYNLGLKFGKLALNMNKKFSDKKLFSKLNFIFGGLINHWSQPYSEGIKYLEESFKKGIEYGDYVYAGYSAIHIVTQEILKGTNLSKTASIADKYIKFLTTAKDYDILEGTLILKNLIEIFQGKQFAFKEGGYLKKLENSQNKANYGSYFIYKSFYQYMFEDYENCVKSSEMAIQLEESVLGLAQSSLIPFFRSLSIIAKIKQTLNKKKQDMRQIKKQLNTFKKWSKNNPENFASMCYLLEAELESLTKNNQKAINYYNKAISEARNQGFLHIEALSYELAAKFYLSCDLDLVAKIHFQSACDLYFNWGATAKVEQLVQKYPNLNLDIDIMYQKGSSFQDESIGIHQQVDIKTIIENLQNLSAETDLKKLQKKMLEKTMKIAGGQRGILLFKRNNELYVEAVYELRSNNRMMRSIKSIPFNKFKRISKLVVESAIAYKEDRILGDAANIGLFKDDPYIQKELPRSILCIPMSNQGTIKGVIYIENNLITDAFSENQLEQLKILGTQMAITFENAEARQKELYAREVLEQRVNEEVGKSKKLMEEAQVLSRQAALANLTKGIAHEIKNPINNMKMTVLTIRDDITNNFYFKSSPEDNDRWKGIVTKPQLALLCKSKQEADALFIALVETGFILNSGELTENFKPSHIGYMMELPEEFEHLEDDVDILLKHTLLKKLYRELTFSLDEEFNRIIRITSSMLQYGETGKGVTNTAFSQIMSFGDSALVWAELVEKGYLNRSGFIEAKFKPNEKNFELNISPEFKQYEYSIIDIIQNNPYALKKPVALNELIMNVSDSCSGRFNRDNIQFTHELTQIPHILGSKDAIKQCLINMFDNSVDALAKKEKTKRKLKITTSKKQFLTKTGEQRQGVEIKIEDTGSGIPKENLEKIRDPFFTTKSKADGRNAGLGMPFVYQTVEGHDGRVDVESTIDKGTTFKLFFPSLDDTSIVM